MARQGTFFGSKSLRNSIVGLPLVVALLGFATDGIAFAQTKPERQSKAAQPTQSSATSSPTATNPNASAENDSGKPEEKVFKGMKYRLIGPFRGGRSLTAAGIPGDPTTYYFGATGGECGNRPMAR